MIAPGLALHFLRPWWWLALLPLPFALWMLARRVGGRAALARIADAALLAYLVRDTGARKRFALALFASTWLLAVAALSGPAWQEVPAPLYVNGAARVVVLSLSTDMLASDLKPDRMTRARFAVRDLLDAAGDARTALVAYAGAAFTVAPLTRDKNTVTNLLQSLRPDLMPVPGNDAAAGIEQAADLLRRAHAEGGEIVLLTDTADAAAVTAARQARSQGLRVDVLGIGSRGGAPVPRATGGFARAGDGLLMARRDDDALHAVAAAGGGRYVVLRPDGSGVAAFAAPVAKAAQASRERGQVWRDGGIWLLPLVVVLAAVAFRRGWLLVLALLVLPPTISTSHAADLTSWFSNRDQRAAQALQRGDAAQAGQLAASPGLRGAAEYRAGHFAEAARAFAQGNGARAQYNLGNALARQGKFNDAIAAYRRALQDQPGMADARANLKAIEGWQKRHRDPSSPKDAQPQSARKPSQSRAPGASSAHDGKQARSANPASSAGTSQSRSPQPGAAQSKSAQSNATKSNAAQSGSPQSEADRGPSAAEAVQQRRQAAQAERGVARAMQGAGKPPLPSSPAASHAFALGRDESQPHDGLDAQQRAILRAVPDDPGALLRRKFRLEWEQRQGQAQQGGRP